MVFRSKNFSHFVSKKLKAVHFMGYSKTCVISFVTYSLFFFFFFLNKIELLFPMKYIKAIPVRTSTIKTLSFRTDRLDNIANRDQPALIRVYTVAIPSAQSSKTVIFSLPFSFSRLDIFTEILKESLNQKQPTLQRK